MGLVWVQKLIRSKFSSRHRKKGPGRPPTSGLLGGIQTKCGRPPRQDQATRRPPSKFDDSLGLLCEFYATKNNGPLGDFSISAVKS